MVVQCQYCDARITGDMKFCANCGAPIPADAFRQKAEDVVYSGDGEYSLVLANIGDCDPTQAGDLLEDLLGYSDSESYTLIHSLPAQIGCNLKEIQAKYIAQALTEYGMAVSVMKYGQSVQMEADEEESLFDNDGNFTDVMMGVLAALTGVNKVSKISKWQQPVPTYMFQNRYQPIVKPVHKKRKRSLLEKLLGLNKDQERRYENPYQEYLRQTQKQRNQSTIWPQAQSTMRPQVPPMQNGLPVPPPMHPGHQGHTVQNGRPAQNIRPAQQPTRPQVPPVQKGRTVQPAPKAAPKQSLFGSKTVQQPSLFGSKTVQQPSRPTQQPRPAQQPHKPTPGKVNGFGTPGRPGGPGGQDRKMGPGGPMGPGGRR